MTDIQLAPVTCGAQWQNCTVLETTLAADPGSSTRFSLSSPYAFNVPVAFRSDFYFSNTINWLNISLTTARTVSASAHSYLPDEGHDGFGSYCSDKDCLSRGVPPTVDDTAVNVGTV